MSIRSWLGSDAKRRRLSWLPSRTTLTVGSRPHIRLELRELEPRRVLDAQGLIAGLSIPTADESWLPPATPLETFSATETSSIGSLPGTPSTLISSSAPHDTMAIAAEPFAVEAQSIQALIETSEFRIQLMDQELVIDSLLPGRADHLAVIFDRDSVIVRSGEFSEDPETGVPREPVQTLLVLPLNTFTGNVLVRTGSGNDTLIVSHLFPQTARDVRFEAGDGQDVLYLEGVPTPSTVVRLTGLDGASVDVHGNRHIAVDATETISSWIQSNDVAVQWSDQDDDVELRDSRFSDRLEIVTRAASDVFFNHPSHQTRLLSGGGDDSFVINGWGDQLRTQFLIDGQAGNDAMVVNRSLIGSHVVLEMAAEQTTVRESLAIGQLSILSDQLVIAGNDSHSVNATVRLSTENRATPQAASMLLSGLLQLDSNLELDADGRLVIDGSINSQSNRFRNLSIRSGDSGVSLGGKIGDGASDQSMALGRIQIQSSGTITWPADMVFRTRTGSVSHLPLQFDVGPKDPTRPFGGDQQRVQQLAGLAGGSPEILQDFAGENLVLTIHWDDGHRSSFAVSGGQQVTLVSLTGQADQWQAVSSSTAPIIFTELGHQYTIDYLVSIVEQGRKFVEAQLELTSDPSIQLVGRPTPLAAPTDLISVETTVRSSVTVGQILFALQPVAFEPPPVLVHSEPILVLPETRSATPQSTQATDEATGVEVNSSATRELVIVTVNGDGEELQSYPLPVDALVNLQNLLQRFIDEGLPDGRYRIYLREVGFPVRKILEFYKSGTTIGTPVRELGPGSNPIKQSAPIEPAPEHDSEAAAMNSATNAAATIESMHLTSHPLPSADTTSHISPFSAGARWRRRLLSSPSRMDG